MGGEQSNRSATAAYKLAEIREADCRSRDTEVKVRLEALISQESGSTFPTSRGAVGWCAPNLGCGRLWVRIRSKAWVLIQADIKRSHFFFKPLSIQYPVGSLPDFRMWGSCGTMPLVSGFSRGFPVSSPTVCGAVGWCAAVWGAGGSGFGSHTSPGKHSDITLGDVNKPFPNSKIPFPCNLHASQQRGQMGMFRILTEEFSARSAVRARASCVSPPRTFLRLYTWLTVGSVVTEPVSCPGTQGDAEESGCRLLYEGRSATEMFLYCSGVYSIDVSTCVVSTARGERHNWSVARPRVVGRGEEARRGGDPRRRRQAGRIARCCSDSRPASPIAGHPSQFVAGDDCRLGVVVSAARAREAGCSTMAGCSAGGGEGRHRPLTVFSEAGGDEEAAAEEEEGEGVERGTICMEMSSLPLRRVFCGMRK
ncbi:hypothetical protein PR048_016958 [Dryococelus australis]|uniref:Uncharacterized protein n=1 Tax=Dryococelus australis TaxID=614101 RepID=A0ABQ9H855_9NEOP|nr:hypothetical protein PR048_016958 [Dryococelus australis]